MSQVSGNEIRSAAYAFCHESKHCSDCPANSNAEDCLIRAIYESKMDAPLCLKFLAGYATCTPVVAIAEGSVR